MQPSYLVGRWLSIAGLAIILAALANLLVTVYGVWSAVAIGTGLFLLGTFISMRTPRAEVAV